MSKQQTRILALELAVSIAGGETFLAKALTKQGFPVSRFTVHRWRMKEEVPPDAINALTQATKVPAQFFE